MRVRTIRYSPGGPSAPQERTVRSYVFHTTRDEYRLWYNFEIIRRTFRTPGADRPPFILEIHQRQQCLWYKLSNSRRTVRAPRGGPSAAQIISPTRENTLSGTI